MIPGALSLLFFFPWRSGCSQLPGDWRIVQTPPLCKGRWPGVSRVEGIDSNQPSEFFLALFVTLYRQSLSQPGG